MSMLAELYEEAFGFAERAVQLESEVGKENASIVFLQEAVESFMRLLQMEEDERKKELVRSNVEEWITKIENIRKKVAAPQPQRAAEAEKKAEEAKSKRLDISIQMGLFSLEQAIAEDEKYPNDARNEETNRKIADAYLEAAQHFHTAMTDEGVSKEWKRKLGTQLESIITRGEELKGIRPPVAASTSAGAAAPSTDRAAAKRPAPHRKSIPRKSLPRHKKLVTSTLKKYSVSEGGLSDKEKDVLINTSTINGRKFLPFLDLDERENFLSAATFADKDAPMRLAKRQKELFGGWRRPEDAFNLMQDPVIVELISPFSITQSVVGDCSFVSSLSVCAMYERMFRKPIITSIIYPQNRFRKPIYNPCGKYVVKLMFNGIFRKVIIDDTLPVSKSGEVMTTTSKQKGELWPSLVEKAYMKVHGGYDFPGSNSGMDLHALIGWVPERMNLEKRDDLLVQWDRLMDGRKLGQCLMTVATENVSDSAANELGIVPSHAYAVLDMRNALGYRLVKLKNPWSHMRWKGRFSEYDTERWTPKLQKALNFDLVGNRQNDNGVFWIDFESLCKYFPQLSISWNPSLFEYQYVLHSKFERGLPKDDLYSFEYNPQFSVNIAKSSQEDTMWILLNKHVNSTEEKRQDYVTLHLFDNASGRKVYHTTAALVQGTYINSPFYLVKHNIPSSHPRKFTVIVSQHEASREISFSIFFYCTAAFKTTEIPLKFPHRCLVKGAWTVSNAGGSTNNPSFDKNPKFLLTVTPASPAPAPFNPHVFVKLETTLDFYISARIYYAQNPVSLDRNKLWNSTGDYRKRFCYLDEKIQFASGEKSKKFVIVASTYEPDRIGEFILGAGSTNCDVSISRL